MSQRLGLAVIVVVTAACGARTGLLAPPLAGDELPLLDVSQTDVSSPGCPDSGATVVFVVAQSGALLSFYPPDATFTMIGMLSCPTDALPFSMAVNRQGTAYVEYDNGALFEVSTGTAACTPTSFVSNQSPFSRFGMGYATLGLGPAEELFLASSDGHLGTLDTTSFAVTTIAPIQPNLPSAELTGTGDGRLFAYYALGSTGGSYIAEVDPTSGAVIGADPMSFDRGNAWAFAFWGGDFWVFTAPNDAQATVMYDPVAKTSTVVAHFGSPIVGAGVSTCAPQ